MLEGKGLILIPAYNEALNLPDVYRALRQNVPNLDILIINDGSIDQTEQVARTLGANIVSISHNLGYGAALLTGFRYAKRHKYEYIVQFDADGQHDPQDIPRLLGCFENTEADIIIGSRYFEKTSYEQGFLKMVGTRIFSMIIRWCTGRSITDPTSGFQVIRRRVFSFYVENGIFPYEYPDANILIFMLRLGATVQEVPVIMHARVNGQGMHLGLFRNLRYLIMMVYSILISMTKSSLYRREGFNRL